MMRIAWFFLLSLLTLAPAGEARDLSTIIAPTEDFTKPEKYELNQGGAGTSRQPVNGNAFSHPAANIGFEQRADFFVGNGFFKRLWVTAPSSTRSADGLGPLYNARACQRCHLKDGRGHPPSGPDDSAVSMFLRLSVPPATAEQQNQRDRHLAKVIPEPTYGGQLQDLAIAGHKGEGRMTIAYREKPVELAGGEVVRLRAPTYGVADLAYGPMDPRTMLSPRVAPGMIGLGLLEAIAEDDILSHADPDDADGDGVSGRPNRVWSLEQERPMLGRFGWKAGNPTLNQQNSEAMAGDIGISNPLLPHPFGECTRAQATCTETVSGANDDGLEAPSEVLAAWQGEDGFYKAFTEADGGNDLYYDAKEAHTALFKAILANLDVIVTEKLERPLDEKRGEARPKRAESWRSERSLDNLIANLETIQALYASEGGLNRWLQGGGLRPLDDLMRKVLADALAAARGLAMPLERAVGDADARGMAEALLARAKRLRSLFATTLADAAQVTLGFNATDGD